ncbi:hypothetical protein PYCCODRAFT_1455800 [Trametes coccinea BRFM310]|uniref:C2H2-type domain-containing protein n=1 Tax=Trametes coccinea (strain BRFM310) TaxID=1353009 RepID=A0A1Y2J2R5_TRAC3|nr:hypothetical protein PYCCODRAFT_1455800 [Trametes coccinea BRFM310]
MSTENFDLNAWVDLDRLAEEEGPDGAETRGQTTAASNIPLSPPLLPFIPYIDMPFAAGPFSLPPNPVPFSSEASPQVVGTSSAVQPAIAGNNLALELRQSLLASTQSTESVQSRSQPSASPSHSQATADTPSKTAKHSLELKENVASTSSVTESSSHPQDSDKHAGGTLGKRKALAPDNDNPCSFAGPSNLSVGRSSPRLTLRPGDGDAHMATASKPTKRARRTEAELANEKTDVVAKLCGYNGGRCEHLLTTQKENRRHLRTVHYPVPHGRKSADEDSASDDHAKAEASSSRSSSVTSGSTLGDGSGDTAATAASLQCTYRGGCPKSFSRLNELQKHAESAHWKQRFQCDICGSMLVRRDALLKHRGGKACLQQAQKNDKGASQ